MLPNIYGTLSETGSKLDLQAEGITGALLGASVPTTVGPFHYYSAFANLSENLSMTSLHNWRESKAAADAAQMSAKDAREIIILAVSGTYLQILASQANVLSQESQVKEAGATFRQSEREYQAGTKPVIDRNRSFVQFHTEQERLTSLHADLVKQFMQLARLIGLPVTQVLTLSEELPADVPQAVPVEEAVKLAMENRSDLKAARMQLKAAQEAHKASKAEYLPSLGISGYYGLQGINPDKGVSVFQAAGTINIPIFQSGRVKADIEQADAAVSQRQAEYDDEMGAVELDVRQSYVDLQVAKEQIEVAAQNRKIAAETLTESLDRFAAGVTNSVEVVQSQETVASAERDYVSSLFTLNLARIRLARAIGLAEQFIPNMLKGN
jgi:outer membrane protein TolC